MMNKKIFTSVVFVCAMIFGANAQSVIFQDFENLTAAQGAVNDESADNSGSFFCYNAGFACIALSDNPNKSGINMSDKVASVSLTGAVGETGSSPNSGLVLISLTNAAKHPLNGTIPACSECPDGKYDLVRFKFYKGDLSERYIRYQPDGAIQLPLYEATATNAWEYVTFELKRTSYVDIRFALNRKTDDSGPNPDGITAETVVYVDDIEFLHSSSVAIDAPARTEEPISIKYYNLQGVTISVPVGVYIMKTIYASGKTETAKYIVQ